MNDPVSRLGPALALILLLGAGCSSNTEKFYPVKGIIVYDDGERVTGLAGGSVTFMPVADEMGQRFSSGTIEADASFVLSCRKQGDGAVAGKHRVLIEPAGQEQDSDNPKKRRPPVKQVMESNSVELEATVETGSNDLKLTIKRPAGRAR